MGQYLVILGAKRKKMGSQKMVSYLIETLKNVASCSTVPLFFATFQTPPNPLQVLSKQRKFLGRFVPSIKKNSTTFQT